MRTAGAEKSSEITRLKYTTGRCKKEFCNGPILYLNGFRSTFEYKKHSTDHTQSGKEEIPTQLFPHEKHAEWHKH